ncbi:hypothetical protein ACOSP7_006410 [Xanthoceras sorbifolium]|uniref:J domain-containing protein n=1 Tax=Xanthoceras sorbifolium TaxID=99658 RepID=A0ABQ8I8Y8_9ROSI|nr:hypothetical protein JRO89_XS03G0050400 [Xanthoceras sorbifolium]
MRCSSYGLVIPGSDSRFFSTGTSVVPPDPSRRLCPTRVSFVSFKIKANFSDACVKDLTGMTFYQLLGIPESGTLPEIKHAYKQLARKYHPDVSPPDRIEEYTRRFIRVQEAYETLSDPRRRALYDRDMSKGLQLAFSARRRYQNDMEMEERSEWKNRWQSQLSELKRRSMYKDARGNMSWGAQMRKQKEDLSEEL